MAGLEDAATVRSLAPTDIDKLKNPQLKLALATLIEDTRNEPSNAVLLQELRGVKQAVAEMALLKQKVNELSERLDDAYQVIHQQQLFLEFLDNKERRRNLIITGVSEAADELGDTDDTKIQKVLEVAGYTGAPDRASWTVRRLGRPNERNKRPIHIMVDDQSQRDNILRLAKNLKDARLPFSAIYIKKDVHPAVRKETARLRKREREEKEKAENVGVNIKYDWKDRVLLRDGVIIDRFAPRFF